MEVQLAVLADAANLSQEGKLNILGVFDRLHATQVPAQHAMMVFVARLLISAGDGPTVDFRFRIVDAEGNLAAREVTFRAEWPPQSDGEMRTIPVVIPITGATFKDFGTYSFELWQAGGIHLAAVTLNVVPRAAA